ncbi:Radical SAM superfamily protein [Desulfonatronum thiosulfatophilum]|uniref:Radical SAM superfamily protein n=1 Tax=Desulfonatronum thiosulfatophilum TaxID=617002 RepID=A0A1G6AGX0_9BACT|nr:radical SAM protein [Desulfonatronum thiosulfatophilum]SDB07682.1 Radical SAM superfamily protein [Desulfonatronum thiosulfatophilum]
MVYADQRGRIFDHPSLGMSCRVGFEIRQPLAEELIPLPEECELFLLPGRNAVGWDRARNDVRISDQTAVAAFVSPGHTLSAVCAYATEAGAPVLPLFAYGAVGFARDRFWVCAEKVDQDPRQQFSGIPPQRIHAGAKQWLKTFPGNRLVRHLANCALVSACPAARNLALGRYEAPLPTSRTCNARCLGCLSLQPSESGFPATQNRIGFRPNPEEIIQVMQRHGRREPKAIFSFGQGCEGEPLTEADLIAESVQGFRKGGGAGTVNVNTNASLPKTIPLLARAGVSSIRVSLNSARDDVYQRYYRPNGYAFSDVRESIRQAKQAGMFVSLNYLFFPGISDTVAELSALTDLVQTEKVDFIQLRNMNLDPELYLGLYPEIREETLGLHAFMSELKRQAPWIRFGYFNPYLAGR